MYLKQKHVLFNDICFKLITKKVNDKIYLEFFEVKIINII